MTEQPFDDEDVPAALERETQDGPGTDDLDALPPSDFESFAEVDVELEDDFLSEIVLEPVNEEDDK